MLFVGFKEIVFPLLVKNRYIQETPYKQTEHYLQNVFDFKKYVTVTERNYMGHYGNRCSVTEHYFTCPKCNHRHLPISKQNCDNFICIVCRSVFQKEEDKLVFICYNLPSLQKLSAPLQLKRNFNEK